jgi:hypothetical protein
MTTSFKKLTNKTKLSETQYYTVEKIKGDQVQLRNDLGEDIVVTADYVEKCLTAADQFDSEKTMSRTDLTNLFLASSNVVTTVNFNTKVKEEDVQKELFGLYPNKGGKILAESDYQKNIKSILAGALTGKERTMIGRHYGSQDEFGRIKFIDMEEKKDPAKDYDTRSRLVDPRTINWLILKGVKYKVK